MLSHSFTLQNLIELVLNLKNMCGPIFGLKLIDSCSIAIYGAMPFEMDCFFLVFFGMTTCTLPSVTKSHYHQPDYTFPAAWSDPGGRSHLEHNSYCIGPKIRHCTFHLSSFDPVCWKLACVPFLYGSLPLCHYALYLRWFYPMCKEETPIMQLQNGVSFPRGWKISGSNH